MKIKFKHPIDLIVTKAGDYPNNIKALKVGSIHKATTIVKQNNKNYVVLMPSEEYSHKTIDNTSDVMYLCERFMVLDELNRFILKNGKGGKAWSTTNSTKVF